MKHSSAWRYLVMLLLATSALAIPTSVATAQGGGTTLELNVVTEAAVGDSVELEAQLSANGGPLAGAEIVFLRLGRFMNNGSDLEIGSAVTDASGIAMVTYVPRSEGEQLIMAEFAGMADVRSGFSETTVFINPGPAQFSQEVGISVPGVNVSLLVMILGAVWVTFLVVMYHVWRIARDGSMSPDQREVPHE